MMVLGFKTHVGKGQYRKETGFVEKILSGQKIHTLRDDQFLRWRAGRKITFATGVRTKHYSTFLDGICSGVQAVAMAYWPISKQLLICIGGRILSREETTILVQNDGFDSVDDFVTWFDFSDYHVKYCRLIHWTDKRY